MTDLDRYRNKLASMQRHDLHRELRTVTSAQEPVVETDGRERVCFASNNYLGLTTHPEVQKAARQAVNSHGTGSGAARLITGNFDLHEELERTVADYKQTDAAVVFGSGYAANIGTLQALAGTGTVIYYDEYNHASLIDGVRLSGAEHHAYDHADVDHLRSLLEDTGGDALEHLVVTDGVFSMDGDLAPLPELADLCDEHDALLMVDDAHGSGVLGEEGRGTIRHLGLSADDVPVQMGTLSKALAAEGGFVAGSDTLIDYLRNRARSFIYSTAPAPPVVAAAREAIVQSRSMDEARGRIRRHVDALHDALEHTRFEVRPEEPAGAILSLVVGHPEAALEMSDRLEQEGLWIPAVRPPTVPRGMSRLRLTVMSTHTAGQVERAADTIVEVASGLDLSST